MRGLELFGGASRPNSEHTRSLEVLPLAEMRHLDKLHISFCTSLQEFEIECPGELQKRVPQPSKSGTKFLRKI